jgi:hypothetical protein
MKWAAAILGAMLYLVWPYYTLLELANGIKSADAPTINRLVDWDRVRASVKAQIQTHLENIPKTVAQREFAQKNPGFATIGNAPALTFFNTFVDRTLTPEGIVNLMQGARPTGSTAKTTQQTNAKPQKADYSWLRDLWQRIRFAFFVSPIHFRLDLGEPDRNASADAQPRLAVILMFKGTGWQVSDLQLTKLDDLSSKLALAPK